MKVASDAILKADQAAYLERLEPARDALLAEMERYAAEHREPISDPEVASFLAVAVRAAAPKSIVEVGTNIGYGAIVLARAAGKGARVVTVEKDPKKAEVARGFVARATSSSDGAIAEVDVRCADALEELARLSGPIDFVYVDCVKEDYPAYLDLVLPKLSDKAVIVADNVLWMGFTAASDVPEKEAKRVAALRVFNEKITTHPELRGVILPLGDGVAYAVRR